MMKQKYRTPEGEDVELDELEFAKYPFNVRLIKVKEEEQEIKKIKEDIKIKKKNKGE